jgi:HAD superfamily phosphatase (TIGR01681 family)
MTTVIFDMDGTLTATARATGLAIQTLQDKYGYAPVSEAHIRSAMGYGGLEFHERLFPGVPRNILTNIEKDVDDLEGMHITRIGRDILFPGVYEMLAALREQGHPLFIASTGSLRHVTNTLKAAGITDFFTGIQCGEPQKIDMVARIINGKNPGDHIMVGDMFKDAEAAKNNGILSLGAGYGYLHENNRGLFDAVLERPEDIFQYVAV